MINECSYFWSFDVMSRKWRNEASFLNSGNMRCVMLGLHSKRIYNETPPTTWPWVLRPNLTLPHHPCYSNMPSTRSESMVATFGCDLNKTVVFGGFNTQARAGRGGPHFFRIVDKGFR